MGFISNSNFLAAAIDDRGTNKMNFITTNKYLAFVFALFCLWGRGALAQPVPVVHGVVHGSDVDLNYFVYGRPSSLLPLMVVNGGPGFSHDYMLRSDVWARIAETRQVIFYDQRGTGASRLPNPQASQNMDAQVSDLEAVRNAVQASKIELAGHSWGGVLVMAYAATHPEHISKLIIIDSGAPKLSQTKDVIGALFPDIQNDDIDTDNAPNDQEAAMRLNHFFRLLFYSEEKFELFTQGNYAAHLNIPVNNAAQSAISNVDLGPELPKFTFPTLVINGRFDVRCAPVTAWRIYKAIPGAQWDVFSKSGHFPFFEEEEKFFKDLTEFMAR